MKKSIIDLRPNLVELHFFHFFIFWFFDFFIFSFFVIFDFSFLIFETYSRIVITAQKSKIKKWKNEKYQRMKKWKTDFKNQKWKNEKPRSPLFLREPPGPPIIGHILYIIQRFGPNIL